MTMQSLLQEGGLKMFMQPGKINVAALPLEEIKEKPPQGVGPLNIVNVKKGSTFKK
jgi:hypothetical protein